MDSTHFLAGKTIIVAGGGIAGSAFAIGLRRLWHARCPSSKPPTIRIYDRDPEDVAAQREGYSLSLAGYDVSGGLLALRNLGLLEDILDKAISGADGPGAFKIWGPDWKEYVSFRRKAVEGLPVASIRIARKDLRSTLHSALDPEDRIQWGSRCVSAQRLDDGRIRVEVIREQDDSEPAYEDCDVLIAADGASSKIRGCLRPDDTLDYAGAVLRGGLSRFDGALPEPLARDWGFMLSGVGVSCFFSPVDKNSIVWGVGHLEDVPVDAPDPDSAEEAQAVIDKALDLGSIFHEPFKTIAAHTDQRAVMCLSARDKKAFHHENIEQLPVIFIGDSNHAVSPFAGYGANLALSDAWDLAEKLCEKGSLKQAVSAYDEVSVPRAMKILNRSRAMLRSGHSTGLQYWMFWLMLMVGKVMGWLRGTTRIS